MAQLKTRNDIERMRRTCRLAGETLEYLKGQAKPGVSTLELDALAEKFVTEHDAVPSTKGYRGYQHSICTAVNDVVIHGIPTHKPLKKGDLITIDVTVYREGFHGDKAATIVVPGAENPEGERLMDVTEESMYRGIGVCRPGARLGDIGAAVQTLVEHNGYSVVRDFCGHGIGRQFHEDPQILHYGEWNTGRRIRAGMVFTVEPMINQGGHEVNILDDGWTVITVDGSLSAQFEHTIAITPDGPEIMTMYTDHEREMWEKEKKRRAEEGLE